MKKYSISEAKSLILKNLVAIILLGIIFGGVMGLVAKHRQQTYYTATRNLIVSHNLKHINSDKKSIVQADQELIPTYQSIIKDRSVAKQAHGYLPEKLRKKYSTDDVQKSISTSAKQNTLVIVVHSKTGSANASIKIVNAVTKAFQKQLPTIDKNAGQVVLLSEANKEDVDTKTKPSAKKYAVAGAALGVLIGMIFSFSYTSIKHLAK